MAWRGDGKRRAVKISGDAGMQETDLWQGTQDEDKETAGECMLVKVNLYEVGGVGEAKWRGARNGM